MREGRVKVRRRVVTLLVIPSDRLENMVRANPRLAIALIRQLARMAGGDDSGASAR